VRINQPILEGRLLRRYKRFLADVELENGQVVTVHCPNTGRLLGCQEPGSRVLLRDSENPARKLRWTWQAIRVGRIWVSVDTSLPNHVVREAVEAGSIAALSGYDSVRSEVPYGAGSRADLLLQRGDERVWVEVKSTTLRRGDTGLFPDAVTARGTKHLRELARAVQQGDRAVQFFFVGRPDVSSFRPADDIDPVYGAALRESAAAGVELLAYTARVRRDNIRLENPIPIELEEPAT